MRDLAQRTKALLLVLAASGACVGGAHAADDWGWASEAGGLDIAAAAPQSARAGIFSRGVARCAVEDDGRLSGCRVVGETPVGAGVGEAVLSLTPKFRREAPGEDDLREVHVVVSWSHADEPGDWRRRPTARDLLAVFPREAYRRGMGGEAVISCISTPQGALHDCVSVHESPAGMGFGNAAIALTPQFTMKPATLDGEPVRSTVRIPVKFGAPRGGPPPGSKRVLPANVGWSEAPTFADLAAAYPGKARREGVGGRATLACNMTAWGKLSNCRVVASSPVGYGFDRAAKALAKKFVYPITTDEEREAARDLMVHLPITFDPGMIDQAEPVVGKPTWAEIPTAEDLRAAFADLKATETGRVMLRCAVQPGGSLSGCAVASEEPAGLGIGAAALALVPSFRLTTWTAEGLPVVGGKVNIPLRFEPGAPAGGGAP